MQWYTNHCRKNIICWSLATRVGCDDEGSASFRDGGGSSLSMSYAGFKEGICMDVLPK